MKLKIQLIFYLDEFIEGVGYCRYVHVPYETQFASERSRWEVHNDTYGGYRTLESPPESVLKHWPLIKAHLTTEEG